MVVMPALSDRVIFWWQTGTETVLAPSRDTGAVVDLGGCAAIFTPRRASKYTSHRGIIRSWQPL